MEGLKGRGLHLLIILVAVFCQASGAFLAFAVDSKVVPEAPIRITSDQLEAGKQAGVMTFRGNVIASQKEGIIMAEYLTVYYGEGSRMEKVVAIGDVRINQKDRVGTCQKATYYLDEKRIVMEEGPRIWREGNMVVGDLITIFMDSENIIVEGAKATIYQEKKSEDAGLPAFDNSGL